MTLLLIVGMAAIFTAIALAIGSVVAVTPHEAEVGRSLAAVRSIRSTPQPVDLTEPFSTRVIVPAMGRLTELGRRFTPAGQLRRIRHKLDLAGSPAEWDTDRVLAFKVLGLLAVGGAGVLLPLAAGSLRGAVALGTAGALVGFFAPDLALYQAAYNRNQVITRALPDAIDLLTISVEAGLGFDAALAQVARNTEGPLAEEFFRVLQEMQIGLGRGEAFRALAERTDVPDLRSFVTSMIQADVFGIPVANVLRIQSREMRIKRSQRAEEAAQKVPVKILFPLIFCILPALFIIVIGPAVISIVRSF